MKPKPLSPKARAIVGKLPALLEHPQAGEKTTANSSGELDYEVRAADGGQGTSVEPGSGGGVGSTTQSPLSFPAHKTFGGGGLSAGADDKRDKEAEDKKDKTADATE